MAYNKQSSHDDDQLRLAAKSVIALRNEKLAEIAKELQFDPGGISGWLGGTPNRLSFEKKEILSAYLGLEHVQLSPKIVHRWFTDAENIKTHMPLLVSKELLNKMRIIIINIDTVTVGCVYYSSIGKTTIVILCKPQNKSFPVSVVNPEQSGWGELLSPSDISIMTWNSWWSNQKSTPEEIVSYILLSHKSKNSSTLESWVSLVSELIQSNTDIDKVRRCLRNHPR